MPKAATNEINDDPLFPSLPPEKVDERRDAQEAKLKVVDLEKVDLKEQFEQEKDFVEEKEREDGKYSFDGNQVSESSESLSQVNIMIMMMTAAKMIKCCISASFH